MEYRTLGRTGLRVSEIGLGGEWFNGLTAQESRAIVDAAQEKGINYIDIFMPQAATRSNRGFALEGRREQFIIQGHLCTVFEDVYPYPGYRKNETLLRRSAGAPAHRLH